MWKPSPQTTETQGLHESSWGERYCGKRGPAEAEKETREGYDILSKQMDPKVSWLVNARQDLVGEYEALKQQEEAAKFKAEIAEIESKAPESASGTKK